MDPVKSTIQDALDELVSARSSTESKNNALGTLERILALACVPTEKTEAYFTFLALQDTFECNLPSRLLPWIASSTSKLEILTHKGTMDHEREAEASVLSAQLCLSLSIIQGVVLHHCTTKRYLGKRYALEVLLELLLASRHLSSMPLTPPNDPSSGPEIPLSSVVLDTVLCILVDSSPALRAFEEANGVQAVVKILKRAGTPREVRMKCLEFLYFYLLDETTPASIAQEPTPPPTAPATPLPATDTRIRAPAPRSSTSSSLSHFRNCSDFTLSSISTTSSFSSSNTSSFSSTSSNASTNTTNLNLSSTSFSSTSSNAPSTNDANSSISSASSSTTTPPRTPPPPNKVPRPLHMLRKDLDFVPQSPKKPQVVPTSPKKPAIPYISPQRQQDSPRTPKKALGVGVGGRGRSFPRSRLGSDGLDENHGVCGTQWDRETEPVEDVRGGMERVQDGHQKGTKTRTTDEKRQILGSMLGNVDALVEGVRKAGVWGLA